MGSEGVAVDGCCRGVGGSRSGFFVWRLGPGSKRAVRPAWLTDVIREVHATSYGSYGRERVHAELLLGRRIRVGRGTVAMLMLRAGIAGRSGAPKRRWESGVPAAEDLVDRVFRR